MNLQTNLEVIIADDDIIFHMLFKRLIKKTEFHDEPQFFTDGTPAFDYLKSNYNPDKTYLIFLDINMPQMNGWAFLENISSFATPKNTKVFMVSSSTDQADINKSQENQFVVDYLSKPIEVEKLEALKTHPELIEFF